MGLPFVFSSIHFVNVHFKWSLFLHIFPMFDSWSGWEKVNYSVKGRALWVETWRVSLILLGKKAPLGLFRFGNLPSKEFNLPITSQSSGLMATLETRRRSSYWPHVIWSSYCSSQRLTKMIREKLPSIVSTYLLLLQILSIFGSMHLSRKISSLRSRNCKSTFRK